MGRVAGGDFSRPLKDVMLERLMDCGTWMSREALAKGASTSAPAIDDTLADLVLERRAEYRQAVGYRLAGTELTRAALKKLRAEGLARSVLGCQVKDEYRVGVAERHDIFNLVMYELALPMPPAGPDYLSQHMAQLNAVIEFTRNTPLAHVDSALVATKTIAEGRA